MNKELKSKLLPISLAVLVVILDKITKILVYHDGSHMAASFRYRPLSVYPTVVRDLALTVAEETPCGELMHEIARACPRVSDVELFDIYLASRSAKAGRAWHSRSPSPRRTNRFSRKKLTNTSKRSSAI